MRNWPLRIPTGSEGKLDLAGGISLLRKLVGSIQWLGVLTRLDLAYWGSVMASWVIDGKFEDGYNNKQQPPQLKMKRLPTSQTPQYNKHKSAR